MKIYIIGIGLIGGSMALDIKTLHPDATVYGIDSNEKHLEEALVLGVVDAAASMDNLSDADFVILSVPVDVALTVLPKGEISSRHILLQELSFQDHPQQ